MSDHTDSAPHAPSPDGRPGPDFDFAGIDIRRDDEADTVTFFTGQEAGDATTAWLTVDDDHVFDVVDCR